jgi:hypothetical protein
LSLKLKKVLSQTLRLGFRIHEVHGFYLTVINKALYGQNHCLLPIENSHNQPQQAKARTAQKSSNLTEKVRHLQDIFRYLQVKCTPCKYLHLPDFILQTPDFILQMPDFS